MRPEAKNRSIGVRDSPLPWSPWMTEQRTFADAILSNKWRTTRREQFLTEMDQVIPWTTVEALVCT